MLKIHVGSDVYNCLGKKPLATKTDRQTDRETDRQTASVRERCAKIDRDERGRERERERKRGR